jgi:hypothetical protein
MATPRPTLHLDDEESIKRAANLLEGLFNLNYLICEEADHANKVRLYVGMSEDHLRQMSDLLLRDRKS